jgi:cytochrome P450
VPLAGRRLAVDLEAGTLRIPAGADVSPAIWLVHMREDLYPQAGAFRPERFLEDPPSTYGWIPFGGGVRRCLGAAFAEMEMRTVLATIFATLDLAPASAKPESPRRRNVTLAPRDGTRVIVKARIARSPAGPLPAVAI